MGTKEILEGIIELCYEINDDRLSYAVDGIDVDNFREDSLDEAFIIIDEIKGEDAEIDYLIEEIEELHKKISDL